MPREETRTYPETTENASHGWESHASSMVFGSAPILVGLLLLVLAGAAPLIGAENDGPITVHLRDGGMLVGTLDPHTNELEIWVSQTVPGIVYSTGRDWADVAAVIGPEGILDIQKVKESSGGMQSVSAIDVLLSQPDVRLQETHAACGTRRHVEPCSFLAPSGQGKVVALQVDACLANWDHDSDMDGLLVRVFPVDAWGMIVPVRGQLTVSARGLHRVSGSDRNIVGEIERWGKQVKVADFGAGGAVYQFPFRNLRDADDRRWDATGLIEARLGVHGQGSYSAVADVRLRRYSRFRDLEYLSERKQLASRRINDR